MCVKEHTDVSAAGSQPQLPVHSKETKIYKASLDKDYFTQVEAKSGDSISLSIKCESSEVYQYAMVTRM